MKRLIILLALLCVPVSSMAFGRLIIGQEEAVTTSGGGGGAWVYGAGSDNYASNYQYSSPSSEGDKIQCSAAGTITKISFKLYSVSADAVKIALFNNSPTWNLVANSSGTIANASLTTGWNDFTLPTPYSCGAGEYIQVMISTQTSQYVYYKTGSTTGFYCSSSSYASFPPATMCNTTDWQVAVRMWVQ
jgi:hypothetical protein